MVQDFVLGERISEGKVKINHRTGVPGHLIQLYTNRVSAGNGEKKSEVEGLGALRAEISAHIFSLLNDMLGKDSTHLIGYLAPDKLVVSELEMFKVEVVVRNVAAGSLAKRLGYTAGTPLKEPIVEFYYKDDLLGDPLLTNAHIRELGLLTDEVQEDLENRALEINTILVDFFTACGFSLIDYKLEFGWKVVDGKVTLVLGDEISPDTCRIQDLGSGEGYDKDIYRNGDEVGLIEAYREVLRRVIEQLKVTPLD